MNIEEYQLNSKRTLAELSSPLLDELHMVLGMQTEAAEIADVYKKHIAYGKPLDYVNVSEEIGDIMWYIANLCNMKGWNLEDILITNINKLKARYPHSFDENKALFRDLDKERQILEDGKAK